MTQLPAHRKALLPPQGRGAGAAGTVLVVSMCPSSLSGSGERSAFPEQAPGQAISERPRVIVEGPLWAEVCVTERALAALRIEPVWR